MSQIRSVHYQILALYLPEGGQAPLLSDISSIAMSPPYPRPATPSSAS